MALQDLLDLSNQQKIKKIGLSEERVREIIPIARQYIAFWREYPDLFVDYMADLNPDNTFHLYYYQRVFMRVVLRHKYVYAVFPRQASASGRGNTLQRICLIAGNSQADNQQRSLTYVKNVQRPARKSVGYKLLISETADSSIEDEDMVSTSMATQSSESVYSIANYIEDNWLIQNHFYQ